MSAAHAEVSGGHYAAVDVPALQVVRDTRLPDVAAATRAARALLEALGLDTATEGMVDTPGRMARAYAELFCARPFAATTFPNDEGYGPSSTPIAVVSRSLRLDWDTPFFTAPLARPILVTVAQAPPDRLARAAEVADVVVAGDRDVDLAAALAQLAERGWQAVLAEGGPTLNGQLAAAGLLDELCLTLSPRLAGGDAKRILDGPSLGGAAGLRLCSLCEQDDFLFLRYRP